MHAWMDGWMHGWMGGLLTGWLDGWMGGWEFERPARAKDATATVVKWVRGVLQHGNIGSNTE